MRQCDECKACSAVFGFVERPNDFQCEWLKGLTSDESRPDKVGLVFVMEEHRNRLERRSLVVREAVPNAFKSNTELLSSLSKRRLIILQRKISHDYLGPADDVEKVKRLDSRVRQQ